MVQKISKAARHRSLAKKVEDCPFITDEELAREFGVSVPTIRLDRMELNIKEHKERIKELARQSTGKIRSVDESDLVGEIVDIHPGENAIALLVTNEDMVFQKSRVVRGNYIYSFAETSAIAVIDANAALVGVANIKYKRPVYAGAKLVAYVQVREKRQGKTIVWVFIKDNGEEVFRGKFLLASLEEQREK